MPRASKAAVTGTRGNVIYCEFGAGPAPAMVGEPTLQGVLAGIRACIGEINGAAGETLTLCAEATAREREAARLLLKALDSIDNVAFQSGILLTGADQCVGGDAVHIAAVLWRFVSAGVAVSQRLCGLAREHRVWVTAEARALQEIADRAGQLEATASDCIRSMHAETTPGRPLE